MNFGEVHETSNVKKFLEVTKNIYLLVEANFMTLTPNVFVSMF